MKTILFLIQKEFRQIFRDKAILVITFVVPTIQFLLLPFAANYEVKNVNLSVVDHDRSDMSQELISKVTGSGYFKLVSYDGSYAEAYKNIESDASDVVLEIPKGFEKNLIKEDHEELFVAVNAINGSKAGLGSSYLLQIISNYNNDIRVETGSSSGNVAPQIDVASSNWFNIHMNYKLYFVPGILALLVTLVGGFQTALNIVKEKEIGTIEQINVTPIKKHHFIIAKLLPFWVLANVVFTVGLFLAWLVYGITSEGNVFVMYTFIALYLFVALGFGLLVSTFCETQQQAMLIMFFFMLIFILLGGLFTPIDSMPAWAKTVSRFNPMRYLVEVMRMVMLKGSSLHNILPHFAIVLGLGIFLNGWAVLNYRKTN